MSGDETLHPGSEKKKLPHLAKRSLFLSTVRSDEDKNDERYLVVLSRFP